MNKLNTFLKKKRILVADGAWGTELIKKNLAPGDIPEVWNLERPSVVKKIAQDYRKAGADIILTNTFGANRLKLKRTGFTGEVKEINRVGVELSKEVAGGSLIFASIGPTGEFLKPVGDFSEQVKGILEGGADGIIIETMSDVKEALCALKAVRKNSSLPVGVTFSFNKGHKGFATMMGEDPKRIVLAVAEEKADIIGANCGSITIEDMVEIAKIMKKSTSLPLWIKPNAGIPVVKKGKTLYPQTPEEMASFIPRLIEAGAKIIGGCCGTTPEHIRQIRDKVDQYRLES
jgi:5-methyltetrahydrofolate--homocysteine methyltransferase